MSDVGLSRAFLQVSTPCQDAARAHLSLPVLRKHAKVKIRASVAVTPKHLGNLYRNSTLQRIVSASKEGPHRDAQPSARMASSRCARNRRVRAENRLSGESEAWKH